MKYQSIKSKTEAYLKEYGKEIAIQNLNATMVELTERFGSEGAYNNINQIILYSKMLMYIKNKFGK